MQTNSEQHTFRAQQNAKQTSTDFRSVKSEAVNSQHLTQSENDTEKASMITKMHNKNVMVTQETQDKISYPSDNSLITAHSNKTHFDKDQINLTSHESCEDEINTIEQKERLGIKMQNVELERDKGNLFRQEHFEMVIRQNTNASKCNSHKIKDQNETHREYDTTNISTLLEAFDSSSQRNEIDHVKVYNYFLNNTCKKHFKIGSHTFDNCSFV